MAVRIGHQREDLRGRRAHKHLAGDPARARVNLNHRIGHASDCSPPAAPHKLARPLGEKLWLSVHGSSPASTEMIVNALTQRLADIQPQQDLAASTDFASPPDGPR
jgi:hypothetical protein